MPASELLSLLSFGEGGWGDELLKGALLTLALALVTFPFGIMFGFLLALAQRSGGRITRGASVAFAWVFKGLPELLTLFLVFYGAQIALRQLFAAVAPGVVVEIPAFAAGVVALGVVNASYASEVWLGAFTAIPQGQYAAAAALGLSRRLTLRLVIFPQLLRHALPGIGNLWMVLLKDTSLVSVISLTELMRMTQVAAGTTKQYFLFYITAFVVYLLISAVSGELFAHLERRSARGRERDA
ncbi:polar amino acid transport system permease protein [Pseudochelatococcus lubricantis]|uniref:Polar amino acid transport system permease protein n=1 Tax=Pseudochelatococcus lubricantis TaxID=1538102 RepID=A0ABX0UYM9_9HYPH|nr:ABC transporter permease subunit [Pseudochelatococcus lubricantis]NIJ57837.1 polar amino acid transport system permease protein [Pseudochelatococcus lubricantis]